MLYEAFLQRRELERLNRNNCLVRVFLDIYHIAVLTSSFIGREEVDFRQLDRASRHLRGVSVFLVSRLIRFTVTAEVNISSRAIDSVTSESDSDSDPWAYHGL